MLGNVRAGHGQKPRQECGRDYPLKAELGFARSGLTSLGTTLMEMADLPDPRASELLDGRPMGDVKRLEAVEDGGAGLRVLNLGGEMVDTKGATGKLILTIFAGFAQFEREMMLERQPEGIAKAKAENRYMGRRPSARLKADEAVKLFKAGRSVSDIATALSIGRGSVYRALETAGMKKASGRVGGAVVEVQKSLRHI
jgi:Resolvase, N terminal domain/Helix-turn-helix domain of resolvase